MSQIDKWKQKSISRDIREIKVGDEIVKIRPLNGVEQERMFRMMNSQKDPIASGNSVTAYVLSCGLISDETGRPYRMAEVESLVASVPALADHLFAEIYSITEKIADEERKAFGIAEKNLQPTEGGA